MIFILLGNDTLDKVYLGIDFYDMYNRIIIYWSSIRIIYFDKVI